MATKKKPTQLDRIEDKLSLIESSLAVIRYGAMFMQELDKATPQPEGLSLGDYTDASKEVADALTAMGFRWLDGDRFEEPLIKSWGDGDLLNGNRSEMSNLLNHLDPATFLSRAAVTAKALGLVPVEPWVPKVNEWVVVKTSHPAQGQHGCVKRINSFTECGTKANYSGGASYLHNLRPATEDEIAAHLAEQEAMKPVEFGTRVECGTAEWVVVHGPDKHGRYTMIRDHDHCSEVHWAKRHEFTVID